MKEMFISVSGNESLIAYDVEDGLREFLVTFHESALTQCRVVTVTEINDGETGESISIAGAIKDRVSDSFVFEEFKDDSTGDDPRFEIFFDSETRLIHLTH